MPKDYFAGRVKSVRDHGLLRITVFGTGDKLTDAASMKQAAGALNKAGAGTLLIVGEVLVSEAVEFTGSVSIIGQGPDARLSFDTETAAMISWNKYWHPWKQKDKFSVSATAGRQRVSYQGPEQLRPEDGDWVVLWGDDKITGMQPHWGPSGSNHPMELHLIENVFGNSLYVSGFVADNMLDGGKGVVIPASEMLSGIVIDNLSLHWAGEKRSPDYSTVFKFVACKDVVITDRVTTSRMGPGAVWFQYCGNCVCNMRFEGCNRDNGVYGIVAGVVNGLQIDGIFRGTRHCFTTTSGVHRGKARWGTPLNVVFDGIVYCTSQIRGDGLATARVAFDTHAEGWGTICKADFHIGSSQVANVAAQSRARGTIFKGMVVQGGSQRSAIGVRMLAEGCRVENCTFQRLWQGVVNSWPYANGNVVAGNTFEDIWTQGVRHTGGHDLTVANNLFENCGQVSQNSPRSTPSVIHLASGTGHQVLGNAASKDGNRHFIDPNNLSTADMKVAGNTVTGYKQSGLFAPQVHSAALEAAAASPMNVTDP